MSFILGKKIKMTQVWKGDTVIPVTVIKAEPNEVNLVRNKDKDGYEAVQLKTKHPVGKKEVFKEFRVSSPKLKSKDKVDVSVFNEGDKVKITGISKSKGFQGVVKRYNFAGSKKTHGTKHTLRAPGSIGAGGVQKVFKGTRMAGRTGGETKSIKNLEIIGVNKETNELLVKGGVPGNKQNILKIVKI